MKKLLLFPLLVIIVFGLVVGGCTEEPVAPETPAPSPAPASSPSPTLAPAPSPTPTPTSTPTPTPAPAPEVKTIKLGYTHPPKIGASIGWHWFAEEFPKRTDGRYEVEVYPSGSLVTGDAILDAVRGGAAEISMSSVVINNFPLSTVATLPTLNFPISEEGYDAAWSSWRALYDKFPEIQKEWQDFKLVWVYLVAPASIVSKDKEIHSPADFKGMKVGGSSSLMMELVKENGGASVHQIPPQSFMNLDKGVTDAAFINWTQVENYKIYDIADWYYDLRLEAGCLAMIMNQETWDAMSPGDQKIFDETWLESTKISAQTMCESDMKCRSVIEEHKTITQPTAEELAVWSEDIEPLNQKWIEDTVSHGVDRAVAEQVLAEWKRLVKENQP